MTWQLPTIRLPSSLLLPIVACTALNSAASNARDLSRRGGALTASASLIRVLPKHVVGANVSSAAVAVAYDVRATGELKTRGHAGQAGSLLASGVDTDASSGIRHRGDPGAATDTAIAGDSAVLEKLEDPHSKLLLIAAMVLNTAVAASLYVAGRLQSRDALMSTSKTETRLKDSRLPPSARGKSKDPVCDICAPAQAVTGASSAAVARVPGECRGFEAASAWRDPRIDLQVGDSSLAAWSSRRRIDALRRLGGCAVMTGVLLVVEVSIGLYIGSLALMSNGFHLLTDVAMYVSLFVAVRESDRTGDRKNYSFGLHRLEVVGVLVALLGQYIISGNLAVTAFSHLFHPRQFTGQAGQIICLTATGSLIVNSSLAFWLGKTSNVHSHSHIHGGMASRMAWLHLVSDAVQNSLVILTGGLLWIDPSLSVLDTICTLAFAVLVVGSTLGILRQLLGIVMERAPQDMDCEQMFKDLEGITGVIGVHCCHAWSIAQGKVALSSHIHVETGLQEDVLQQAQIILKHRYGIHHVTLQISDDEDLA